MRRKTTIAVWVSLSLMLLLLSACSASTRKRMSEAGPSPADTSTMLAEKVHIEEAPILVRGVDPPYPTDALAQGITGVVWVKIHLDTLGRVTDAIIVRDSGKNVGFEAVALQAAREQIWKPALSDGRPIEVWVTYKVEFKVK